MKRVLVILSSHTLEHDENAPPGLGVINLGVAEIPDDTEIIDGVVMPANVLGGLKKVAAAAGIKVEA